MVDGDDDEQQGCATGVVQHGNGKGQGSQEQGPHDKGRGAAA